MTCISSDILCLEIEQNLLFIRHVAILKNGLKQADANTGFVKQALKVPDLRSLVPPGLM